MLTYKKVKTSLANPLSPTVSWMHEDKLNSMRISAPLRFQSVPPPITVSLRRRLFPSSLTLGSFEVTLNRQSPTLNVSIVKPPVLSAKRKERGPSITTGWTTGLSLRGLYKGGPAAFAQCSTVITDLKLALTSALEYGLFTGPACVLSGEWSDNEIGTEIGAQVACNLRGVHLKINLDYLGQSIVLPITLTDEYAPRVALAATLVPAAVFLLADYFILRARRAARLQRYVLWLHINILYCA